MAPKSTKSTVVVKKTILGFRQPTVTAIWPDGRGFRAGSRDGEAVFETLGDLSAAERKALEAFARALPGETTDKARFDRMEILLDGSRDLASFVANLLVGVGTLSFVVRVSGQGHAEKTIPVIVPCVARAEVVAVTRAARAYLAAIGFRNRRATESLAAYVSNVKTTIVRSEIAAAVAA